MILIGRSNWVPPRRWKLWSLPRPALSYVLGVDAVAVIITALAAASTLSGARTGVRPSEWAAFAVLAAASVLHLESARGIERRREMAANTSPYTNLKSLWVFAGLLLLPLILVVALIVVSYGYSWIRVYGRTIAHRKVFSASTFLLASAAAAAVLRAGGLLIEPRVPTGPWTLLVVIAAATTWWLVNFALVIGAILLSSPDATARGALGDLADQLVVVAGLGLGVAVAALQASYPWVVPILMVTVLTLHRDLLLPQFQRAAGTDVKTGLATPAYWASAVPVEIARAQTLRSTVGLLMLDLDKFKEINDTYGHRAGDEVLRRVAELLRAELRQSDLAGRMGGDEFAAFLAESDQDTGAVFLHRLRRRIGELSDSGELVLPIPIAISAGVTRYPDDGEDAETLFAIADARLYEAKRANAA